MRAHEDNIMFTITAVSKSGNKVNVTVLVRKCSQADIERNTIHPIFNPANRTKGGWAMSMPATVSAANKNLILKDIRAYMA